VFKVAKVDIRAALALKGDTAAIIFDGVKIIQKTRRMLRYAPRFHGKIKKINLNFTGNSKFSEEGPKQLGLKTTV
jgi:hypothetical protein